MTLTETQKQTLLVGGILGGAILIILVYIGFMMVSPAVEERVAETAKLQKEYSENVKKLERYKTYLDDTESYRKVQEAFGEIRRRLPDVSDPIEVIDILRDYIEGTDVAFTALSPGNEKRRERYTEFPITLRGSARYHQFGQLVNLVECNPDRLMRVTGFRLANNNARPSIHPMEISIETYTFNEN